MNLKAWKRGIALTIGVFTTVGTMAIAWNQPEIESATELENSNETVTKTQFKGFEEGETYVQFSMNVHDWVFPEQSVATLHRVIDLHEAYEIPIDIYLTDPTFQIFMAEAPDLVERFKNSPVVCINYHVRPPAPYYPGFDWLGFDSMTDTEKETTLTAYEEHALNLETGEPTDDPGGYEYLKKIIGYAPKVVGITGTRETGAVLAHIYQSKGALFTVVHGREIEWGETQNGLTIRPETIEIKLYEYAPRTQDGATVLESVLQTDPSKPQFIGIKYHENNFYSEGTTFNAAFWEDPTARNGMLYPPYDLSRTETATLRSEEEAAKHWALYESTLDYVASHSETLIPINAFDLEVALLNNL